jgi:Tfp pilus assembly protein PilO
MDLKKLKDIKLTQKQQTQIFAGVILLGFSVYAYWNYLFTPLVKNYKAKVVMLQQKQKDLQDAKNMASKYPEFLRRASAINEETEFLSSRFPANVSFAGLIEEISDKAAANGVTIKTITPDKEVKKGEYTERKFRVSVKSGYNNLGAFITGLGYSKILIVCDEIKMKTDTDSIYSNDNINTDMVLRIFSIPEAKTE